MKIGFAKTCITPSLPIALGGFAKERVAHQVHDDLYVQCILIQIKQELYGILAYDLVAIDHLIIQEVKKQAPFPLENLIFTATHTHSGPGGVVDTQKGLLKGTHSIFGKVNSSLIDEIAKKSVGCIKAAMMDLTLGTVKINRGELANLGSNRNEEQFPGDNRLFVVEVENQNHKGVLIHYACHPTILNMDNICVSGDFVGGCRDLLLAQGYEVALYLNGSCGDISTRFTRKGSGYEEIARSANLLSEKVMELVNASKNKQMITEVKKKILAIELKIKKADSLEEAEMKYQKAKEDYEEAKKKGIEKKQVRVWESYLEGAMTNLQYAKVGGKIDRQGLEITIYKVDQEIFVLIPGELFSQLSNKIKDDHLHFIAYANGYYMYFADEYAYEHHFYEAQSSPFEKGQGEYLIERIKQGIAQM